MTVTLTVSVKNNQQLHRIIEFIEGYGSALGASGCSVEEVDYTAGGAYSAKKTRSALSLPEKVGGKK